MSRGAHISFAWFGLLVPLLGFLACSGNNSGANANANANASDLPQGTAGTLGTAGSSGSGGLGGKSASSGAAGSNFAGAFAQGGASPNAGSGGSSTNSNTGGASGAGSSGGPASTAGTNSAGGTNSGGSPGTVGAAGGSAAFAKVSSILGSTCGIKGCHADKQSPHFVPGPMLYSTLTGPNTVLAACGYTKFVEAGDPEKSALIRLMNRQCDGFTMPPSCNKTPCLAAADLKTLSDWIQAGAPP